MQDCYEALGIGFGPANVALAIALEEAFEQGGKQLCIRFLEARQDPVWQGGMLLDGSNVQNHPCRDLVTLRNPRSRYSFLNYLFEQNRLIEHLNLPVEFPLRKEYAQYITWVSRHFDHLVDYGEKAMDIRVVEHGGPAYRVRTASGRCYLARSLVVAPGRTPYVPKPFDAVTDNRIFPASDYLYRLDELTEPPETAVVIGGSQSAVEITLDLAKRYPQARVLTYLRSFGLRLKDTSPFSEEGFFPDFTDYYFEAGRSSKRALDSYMRPTNYSSADADVLHELYLMVYEQRLDGKQRVFIRRNRQVCDVAVTDQGLSLTVVEVHTGVLEAVDTDLVVLATGFRDLGPEPQQEPYPALLSGIAGRLCFDDDGYLSIDKDYQVMTSVPGTPPLLINGLCETSHGIGDSGSFSLLSLRAEAIQERLIQFASNHSLQSLPKVDRAPARKTTGPDIHQEGESTVPTWDEPHVSTPLPGPLSKKYLARQNVRESNARTYPRRLPIAIRRAEAALVEDVDGNVFLDFLSGAGVLSLGHSHPEIIAAVQAQLSTFVHGLDLPTPVKDRFTELQLEMLPASMRDRMRLHFCGPTGANGVEAAIKLCKLATGRSDIIAFHGGFHGSTTATMSASGNLETKSKMHNGMPGVHFFPYSYCPRCPIGLIPDTCATNCATYLGRVLSDPNGGVPKPAAVLVEVVQGEGGSVPATMNFLRQVREITVRAEVPLIVDEVQTGCGRTGTWFAFEQYGIEPDVIVASKALTGIGLPASIIIYDQALDRWEAGAHIGTFRGNQLAFAAGIATIEVIRRDNILENVRRRGDQLGERLRQIAARTPWVADVRGMGLMWGIELVDPHTGADASVLALNVQAAALRNGLILEVGGRNDCVLRPLPPLTITEKLVDKGADLLERAFVEADPDFRLAAAPTLTVRAG
jgi:diaminobutyrate-2-oxoglutarate transaminase